jgi:hypothetical protein
MGFIKDIRDFNRSLYPERVVRVESVKRKWFGWTRLYVLVFTGEESVWQAPVRDRLDTVVPPGRTVEPGTLLVEKVLNNGRAILWDRPEPTLPPMQFPNVPGGDDPAVMIEHLRYLVSVGALDQEGLQRGEAYLRNGWPPPS